MPEACSAAARPPRRARRQSRSSPKARRTEGAKFRDYFDRRAARRHPLAPRGPFRARNEGMLQVSLVLDSELDVRKKTGRPQPLRIPHRRPLRHQGPGRPADKWLADTVRWTWKIKVFMHLELELMNALRERAEEEAIRVFGRNLKGPAARRAGWPACHHGPRPGIRTGCKIAVVGGGPASCSTPPPSTRTSRAATGRFIAAVLAALCAKHQVELVAIGNGTASRETDKLVADLMKRYPAMKLTKIVVSEAGASVYSASGIRRARIPELDVSLRGAVSIARRLQDPLAELVKIEAEGHRRRPVPARRVNQTRWQSLDAVVEDCVNAVGVDVNTASVRCSRASPASTPAGRQHRFLPATPRRLRRPQRLKVPRLGDKTFEQAAGFLRIMNGDNPLDASAVHRKPTRWSERILADMKKGIKDVIGDASHREGREPAKYADDKFGLPTVQDILKGAGKAGPRPAPRSSRPPRSATVSKKLSDLEPGMMLEGVVTNVPLLRGLRRHRRPQDGLVHVSALADRFVKDPHEVVKAGDIVKVKVTLQRQRVALTMRMSDRRRRRRACRPPTAAIARASALCKTRSGVIPGHSSNRGGDGAAFAKLQRWIRSAHGRAQKKSTSAGSSRSRSA